MGVTDSHGKTLTNEERKAAVHRLQQDLIIYQSDADSLGRELEEYTKTFKTLEKKIQDLNAQVKAGREDFKKKEEALFIAQEEIKQIKKRINQLA